MKFFFLKRIMSDITYYLTTGLMMKVLFRVIDPLEIMIGILYMQ